MEQKFSVTNVPEFVCTLGVLRGCLFPKNFENAVPFVKCSMAKGHHIPKFPEKKGQTRKAYVNLIKCLSHSISSQNGPRLMIEWSALNNLNNFEIFGNFLPPFLRFFVS